MRPAAFRFPLSTFRCFLRSQGEVAPYDVWRDQSATITQNLDVTQDVTVGDELTVTGKSCFNDTVGMKGTLLVNEINPISSSNCYEADDNGTTTFSGNVAMDKE